MNVVGSAGGGGNITCESNTFVLGKVACSKLQLYNSLSIASIRCLNVIVGNGGTSTGFLSKTYTYEFFTYTDIIKLSFTITFNNNAGTSGTGYNYTFSSTIVSVTTTTMTFNVQRTDSNAAWTNNLIAQIIITETA